ncbi:MAG: ORC1-type DNA replication protein 2 [Methanoregulaceae archaeon PtaB.Bin009]|nr:MAG: ORC1-type DNA replication protein 2 [Methanoregulaceae archaeon PtaB.Bin009]OPY42307.1 MAG: ORC1-type DNA replication protein 2 [Methanoregulaceae archaeon PtaU1.Bin066]HNQ30393.1 ORC1-type DNA replication protein [Methanolinea sp.]
MKKNLLMWDETLFRDPEVFEIDYVPEQFNFRETQMRELAFQIRPGLRGGRPLNTICRGLPGTGKTTSVKKLFAEIEETTKKLVPIHVNCQIDNTKFAIFSQIYRKLSGHLPPSSGTSFKQVFDAIARILAKEEQVLLVALDDANYLLYENEINKVLYTLLRSHESYPGTRVGVIMIVSDMAVDIASEVDARVSSVFRPTEIYFPPYTMEEVKSIISERVMQGLYPGCLPPGMFDLVVEQTQKSGDLRVGVDLLKRAALNAEKRASRVIERDDICGAYQVSRYLHLAYSVKSLKEEEKALLRTLAIHAGQGGEMNAGEVYKTVKEEAGIGYTRFYEIVKKFDAMRLVNLEYRDGKGRTRVISLRYEPVKILEYLS